MKKHRYTAAAVMLSLSMLTGAAAADYSDLKPHWAEQAMEFAVQSNLMDGISEYTFAADAPATRACLVQALYRMEHAPAADTVLTFQDVAEDASFLIAVQWGVSNGIITGYSDTVFRPGTSLTREQFAVMLYRFAEYKKLDVTVAYGHLRTGWGDMMRQIHNPGVFSIVYYGHASPAFFYCVSSRKIHSSSCTSAELRSAMVILRCTRLPSRI